MPSKKKKSSTTPKRSSSPRRPSPSEKSKSSKSNGSETNATAPPVVPMPFRLFPCKMTWTGMHRETEADQHLRPKYRCTTCKLLYEDLDRFISHECWRKYHSTRKHLAGTRAFGCRRCNSTFAKSSDFAGHKCLTVTSCVDNPRPFEVEDVIPIDDWTHLDFYIGWNIRCDREKTPHQPRWNRKCRCNKCGNIFPSKLTYMLHSCFQFALLNPASIRKLKTCNVCCFVLLDEQQFEIHRPLCDRPERAFMRDLEVDFFEIFVQQMVLGRHCYEFDWHLHNNAGLSDARANMLGAHPRIAKPPAAGPALCVTCYECKQQLASLDEFLLHTCNAGADISPLNLELTLYCNSCQCLFMRFDRLSEHMMDCRSQHLTFVRLNTERLLRLSMRRWTKELFANRYLPCRQQRFQCTDCSELYRTLMSFIKHPCPKRERYERLLIQPLSLLETFSCHACYHVHFSASEAVTHSNLCPVVSKPYQVQVHYNMEEMLAALEPWMRCPQLLAIDTGIGSADLVREPEYICGIPECGEKLPPVDSAPTHTTSERIAASLNKLGKLHERQEARARPTNHEQRIYHDLSCGRLTWRDMCRYKVRELCSIESTFILRK